MMSPSTSITRNLPPPSRIRWLKMLRPFFFLSYWLVCLWFTLIRKYHRGVYVLIRYQNECIVVQHSYRFGWSFPGGGLLQGETWEMAALREVKEEVGIDLTGEKFHILGDIHLYWNPNAITRVLEVRLSYRPQITIDGWEIIDGVFLPFSEVLPQLPPRLSRFLKEKNYS